MATPFRSTSGLAAITLLLATGLQLSEHRAARRRVIDEWTATGIASRHPQVLATLERETDPIRGRLAVGRAVLADALDSSWLEEIPEGRLAAAAAKAEERLADLEDLAPEVLAGRPVAWEAPMFLGGARFLSQWRLGRPELYRQPQGWLTPLQVARGLAPGSPEPERLLVTGYLTIWHTLADEVRSETRTLLSRTFDDSSTFDRLLPVWVRIASSWDELVAPFPSSSRPWARLRDTFARNGDWAAYCRAREGWRARLLSESEERLAAATDRLRGGDRRGARQELLALAAVGPPDRQLLPVFVDAVRACPTGPVPTRLATPLRQWLEWSLELQHLGQPGLPDDVLLRLTGMIADLEPAIAARAAIVAGDLVRAEQFEGREDRLWSEEWASYVVSKADLLLQRGKKVEAIELLEQVHRSRRQGWRYRVATAKLRGEEPVAVGEHSDWTGSDWQWRGGRTLLELDLGRPGSGLRVAISLIPARGAAVEMLVDGGTVGCFPLQESNALEILTAMDTGAHLLEWRALGGGRPVPDAVVVLQREEEGTGG